MMKMRLGLVGLEDPQSIRSHFGTPYCMAAALKRQGCEISFFLQLAEQNTTLARFKNRMTRPLTGKHILRERDPRVVRDYPDQINAAIRQHQVDAVLGTSSFYMATKNCP